MNICAFHSPSFRQVWKTGRYVCIFTYIHIHIYIKDLQHTDICTPMIYAFMCVILDSSTHIHTYTHTVTLAPLKTREHTYIHTYIYTHTYICIHTDTLVPLRFREHTSGFEYGVTVQRHLPVGGGYANASM